MDKYDEVRKKYPHLLLSDDEVKMIKQRSPERGRVTCLLCGWYFFPEAWDTLSPGDPWVCSACKFRDPRLEMEE